MRAHEPRGPLDLAGIRAPSRGFRAVALLLALACGGAPGETGSPALDSPVAPASPAPPAERAEAAALATELLAARLAQLGPRTPGVPRVVFLGDSFTTGFGLARGQSPWPERLAALLAEEQVAIEVVNAGVVGDTSQGGLQRLPQLASLAPDVLVIELGGNDVLAGLPLAATQANLREIVAAGRALGARVLLCGLSLPPALLVTARGRAFVAMVPALADELDVELVPDLVGGVMDQPRLLQADGLHPNAEGHAAMARNALAPLRELLPTPVR